MQSLWEHIKANVGRELVLVIRRPSKGKRYVNESHVTGELRLNHFADSEIEARKFAAVIKLLQSFIVNLEMGNSTTKRDIYYQDVDLFQKTQGYVNDLVEILSYSLGLSLEEDMKVFASQKGLVFSNMALKLGQTISLLKEPILIPRDKTVSFLGTPHSIVVVEKDAVFKSFCEHITQCDLNLIVVTGKGFPDNLTKGFVEHLSRLYPIAPVLGFMDSDVYGLGIFKSYLYTKDLAVLRCNNFHLAGAYLLEYTNGWLNLSIRDWRMMFGFIKNIKLITAKSLLEYHELQKWHREMARGIFLFKKSELNVIDSSPNEYMMKKIRSHIGFDLNSPPVFMPNLVT